MRYEYLVGKEILGFKFEGGPGFPDRMKTYIGKTGKIIYCSKNVCAVEFNSGKQWSYPYPEILDHLVKESTLNELFDNVKSVINACKKEKVL